MSAFPIALPNGKPATGLVLKPVLQLASGARAEAIVKFAKSTRAVAGGAIWFANQAPPEDTGSPA
jgi:hypothetical protein